MLGSDFELILKISFAVPQLTYRYDALPVCNRWPKEAPQKASIEDNALWKVLEIYQKISI